MRTTHDESLVGRVAATGLLTLAVVVGGWMLAACSAEADNTNAADSDVVAIVDGKAITKAEVEESAADQLKQTEAQLAQCELNYQKGRHDVIEATTRQVVQERLVEAEAAKRGVTKEALLEEIAPAPVTEADVDAFYEENKARIGNRTKEQVAPQIEQYLAQQRQAEAQQGFYEGLEAKYAVEYKIEPYRVDVAAAGAPSKGGPANAPVTIVEFSDFECPFCSRVNPTLDEVQEKYGDKVRIVFRQFPLGMHPNAPKAAEASLCAHDQGKFWELHDLMFEEQKQLTVANLKEKAERLGLDTAKFNECLDSDKYAAQVQEDMQAGSQAGVSGTPAMFINGRLVSGAVPFDQLAEVIDDELARKGSGAGASK